MCECGGQKEVQEIEVSEIGKCKINNEHWQTQIYKNKMYMCVPTNI
jgi:hypothetical protein